MRGAETIIPARFLSLIGHLCVLITLLWESQQSIRHCLPSQHYDLAPIYHSRSERTFVILITSFIVPILRAGLVAGFAVALSLIVLELATFMFGLTMFSPSVSLISIGAHGSAAIVLTYFVLDGWLCDWYWPILAFCSVLPACVDVAAALFTLCSSKWYSLLVLEVVLSFNMGERILNALKNQNRDLFMDLKKEEVTNEHQQLTRSHEYKGGWSFYLALAGIATTIGSSLPVGYNIGVVNTPADIIKRFCNESIITRYDVVLDEKWLNVLWSSIVSIFIVGGCTGSILGALLANSLGRKMATVITNILSLIGAVMFLFCRKANSVEMLILGRLLVGLSGGLTTSIVPMYLTELAPPKLSGAMGVACPMGVNVGVLVGQVMGLDFLLGGAEDWPYLLSVYAVLVILCLPVLFILPESPKYLYVVKRDEQTAINELSRLRGESASILTEDIELLREESQAASSMTLNSIAVFYYSQTIFKQAGLTDKNAQYATIASGFINVCTAVVMVRLLPRYGRRPLLLASVLSAAVLLAALGASMTFIKAVSWMPHVCMTAVLLYVLVYGFGLGPIPYFIASEIFEVGPRPAGMAWGSLANWGGNFLVGMSFPTMRETIGSYSFLVFSAVTLVLFVFQKMYFPETRGKTPAQITQLCDRGFKSRPLITTHFNGV